MGKLTSIYLTDEETTELKRFYEENACSQYKAIKIGLKELFSKHTNKQKVLKNQIINKRN
jgi:hypothetical protein